MRNRLLVLILLMFFVVALAAQDFVFKKPFSQWSAKDAKKVLEDSAWTDKESLVEPQFVPVNVTSGGSGASAGSGTFPGGGGVATADPASGRSDATGGEATGRESSLETWYRAQIRSALPIRQAMVRQAQLEQKYDKMTAEQKASFDAQAAKLLNTQFHEHIVISIAYGSNVQVRDNELARFWQTRGVAEATNDFSLIGSGGRIVRPIAAQATPGAGREFQVVFPRTLNGEPLVGPDDNELVLEFTAPEIQTQKATRIRLSFKVKKMLSGRELIL